MNHRWWLEPALNIWAFVLGCVGFVLSLLWQRDPRDLVERMCVAFFVFMQTAMWGAEMFYVATVVLRLSGHGLVIR